jgi:hypothetical protein
MSQPVWQTPAGSLGTIPEGVFYSLPLVATSGNTVYYQLIAGALPGGMQIDETGIITGIPNAQATIQGVPLDVPVDTLSKFAVRAYTRTGMVVNRLVDRTFTIEVANTAVPAFVTPAGQLSQTYDGTLITDLQIEYTGPDNTIVRLISGSLPPGLTVNTTGLITGLIGLNSENLDYPFTLQLTDGTVNGTVNRSFSIYVWSRSSLSADNTDITADNTFITADGTPILVPILLNTPGSIGTVRSDNFFAYQFTGVDLNGDRFEYLTDANVPGLTLDPNSGWFYGNIPPLGINNQTYSFNVRLNLILESELVGVTIAGVNGQFTCNSTQLAVGQEVVISGTFSPAAGTGTQGSITGYTNPTSYYIIATNASTTFTLSADPGGLAIDTTAGTITGLTFTAITEVLGPPYAFSLTVIGPVSADVTWLVPDNLGTIDNGATSTFYIAAVNRSGVALQYQLLSGSDSRLPQGLELLPTGEIAGRVSFNTFALDQGTTTFDKDTTTFDLVCYFTVNVYSVDGLISSNKVFSIQVIRAYNEPYNNLYIQAMPPLNDRVVINSLLQNSDIFQQPLLYRPTDPNFGVAKNVTYYHAYGLTAATYEDYVTSLDINHYWKNLVLGQIEVAQAIDTSGTVIYEVVYSRVIDDLVNAQGQSVSKDVTLPYPVTSGVADGTTVVYPNSLINMRDQVIDTVGQISNTLPLWMICKQANGQTLGFTPAWVIAYANPGRGEQLAYYIGQDFIDQLNIIDFEVDRYELDNLLTKNWNREEQYWGYDASSVTPHPPSLTTFDLIGLPIFDAFRTTLTGAGTLAVNQTYSQIEPYKYAGNIDSEWIMYSADLGNTWNIRHDNSSANYYTSTDLVTWSVGSGAAPAPTASFYQVGDVVAYQTVVGDVRINKIYKCIQATTPNVLPTNATYWDPNGQNIASWINDADAITTWEDDNFTLANWTYATPPGTTFDGGSMQFTAPVDMYSNTNEYDKYLVFPRRNILSPLPPPSNLIIWTNNQSQPFNWVNDEDQPIEWAGLGS